MRASKRRKATYREGRGGAGRGAAQLTQASLVAVFQDAVGKAPFRFPRTRGNAPFCFPRTRGNAPFCFPRMRGDAPFCFPRTRGNAPFCFPRMRGDAPFCFPRMRGDAPVCFPRMRGNERGLSCGAASAGLRPRPPFGSPCAEMLRRR